MTLQEWLKAMPVTFPETMGYSTTNTPFQNPLIGDDQEQTYRNVGYLIEVLMHLALPSYTKRAELSLNENATWGIVVVLECISSALNFEHKHRPEGGEPIAENAEPLESKPEPDSSKPDKANFKPYHGQPFNHYRVFCKKPNGNVKQLAKMIAPNDELAMAKATENFAATIADNCTLFVAQHD